MIIRCSESPHDCIPCCDFCKYARHEVYIRNGKHYTSGPIGCKLHPDEEHKSIAEGCGYCEDFCCERADKASGMWFEGWPGLNG